MLNGISRYAYSYRYVMLVVVITIVMIEVLRIRSSLHSVIDASTSVVKQKELETDPSSIQYPFIASSSSRNKPVADTQVSQNLHDLSGKGHYSSAVHKRPRKIYKGRPSVFIPPKTDLVPAILPTPNGAAIPLNFLHASLVRSTAEIFENAWMVPFQKLLTKVNSHNQISIIFATSSYTESVLNWLIAAKIVAKPPVSNVIVICLSKNIFDILSSNDIPSLFVLPETVIDPNAEMTTEYMHVWIIRCVFYRLINYLGYDVVSFDSDAIVFKNPQVLFNQHEDSDIIGSAGTAPFELGRKWGQTLCMGVILFRSTPRTEMFWESVRNGTSTDQSVINYNLLKCGIHWNKGGKSVKTHPIDGHCQNGLKVTVLPLTQICRRCDKRRTYYVRHQLSKKIGSEKKKVAQDQEEWLLRVDWRRKSREGKLKGNRWLASLSVL